MTLNLVTPDDLEPIAQTAAEAKSAAAGALDTAAEAKSAAAGALDAAAGAVSAAAGAQEAASGALTGLQELKARVDELPTVPATPAPAPVPAGQIPGLVFIDSFEGATDGAKLRAAMAYAAAQSQKPGLVVRPGATYDAGANPFQLYPGFKILGMNGGETEFSYNTRVNVRGTNGVFACVGTGATKGMLFKDIGFEGSIGTVFLRDNPMDASGAYPGNSQIDGCSFDVFKHIYWGPISALQWFGTTYINNVKETALHVGGSDSVLFKDGGFLDHNGGTTREERLANKGLLRFSYLNKSIVGPIYTTGDPGLGVLVDGGGAGLIFEGSRFEGRNAGKPAAGATIRVNDAHVTFRDVWAAYSMANPSETGRDDAGTIHVAGGSVLIDGAYYKRANGVSEDVPFVAVTGGRAVVRNIQSVGMAGLPKVRQIGGTVLADDTVQVIR